jgi:hypothetical protein
VKRAAVLAVRREVNHLRRAGLTEAQIATSLTRLRMGAPSGHSWVEAGIGPRWSARGVTRFMEATRHVEAARPVKAARRAPGVIHADAPVPMLLT